MINHKKMQVSPHFNLFFSSLDKERLTYHYARVEN